MLLVLKAGWHTEFCARRLQDEPTRNRDNRAKPFNYMEGGPLEEPDTTGGYGK